MKTIKFLMLITTFCLINACSKDSDSKTEISTEELLIENSPWVFNHYELSEILEGDITDIELLENDTKTGYNNLEFNFYKNGKATLQYPNSALSPFDWVISNNNLLGTPDPDFDGPFLLKNISVSKSEFSFQLNDYFFNIDTYVTTTHTGTFYFN